MGSVVRASDGKVIRTFESEESAIKHACKLRSSGNFDVNVVVEVKYEDSRRYWMDQREAEYQRAQSDVQEEGRDGASNELHNEQSANSVGTSS